MEHKLLVLCDPEEDYAQHMADFLRRKKDMDWEVRIFTVQEELHKFCAEEAIEIWLEDNEYEINEEQEALHQVAKQVRVDHGARADQPQKDKRERTVKISDEKQTLFAELRNFLTENYENVTVLKENKLFEVKIGDKTFKIDLIQQRDKK